MIKIFISQPMKGRSDEEILQERAKIKEFVQQKYNQEEIVEIPSFIKSAPIIKNPLWYLGRSIEFMANADIVVFAPDWETARGCLIEHIACLLYNIPMYELECGRRK